MAIDPQILAYYHRMAEQYAGQPVPVDASARRARFDEVAAQSLIDDPAGMAVTDITIETGTASLPVRLFRPADVERPRLIVYFHGGGWVVGSPRTHHTVAALLAEDTGCVVASVDYRLAPEHAFPAPCARWRQCARRSTSIRPSSPWPATARARTSPPWPPARSMPPPAPRSSTRSC
jgi:acetyl esterase